MNNVFQTVFFLIAVSVVSGCRCDSVETAQTRAGLKSSFEAAVTTLPKLEKDAQRAQMDVLKKLLDAQSERDRTATFRYLTRCPPSQVDQDFEMRLTQAFFERLQKKGESSKLQKLMEHRCPDYVVLLPLEALLAMSKGTNDFLLLFKAYYASKTPSSAATIIGCLSRAFPSLRVADQSDMAFVRSCEEWYLKNRDTCQVNKDYPHFVSSSRKGPPDLFISNAQKP